MADGSLDFDEFMACTKKLHACNGADEKELRRLFESYKDGENGISHDCFQYAVAERLRERFAVFIRLIVFASPHHMNLTLAGVLVVIVTSSLRSSTRLR